MRNSSIEKSSNQIPSNQISSIRKAAIGTSSIRHKHKLGLLAVSCLIAGASVCGGTGVIAYAADGTSGAASADISAQVQALAAQIAHLSAKVQSDPVASKAVAPVLKLMNSPSFSWDQVLFGTDSPTSAQMAIAQALTPSMQTLAQFNVTSQSAAASIVSTVVQQVGAIAPSVPATDVIAFLQAVEGQSMVNLLPLSAMSNPTVANVESAMHLAVVQSSSSIPSVQAALGLSAGGSTSTGSGSSTGNSTGGASGSGSAGSGTSGSGSNGTGSTGSNSTESGASTGTNGSSGNTTSGNSTSGNSTGAGNGTSGQGGSGASGGAGNTTSGTGTGDKGSGGSSSTGSGTSGNGAGNGSGSTSTGTSKGSSGNTSGSDATEGGTAPTKGIVLANGKFGANQKGILVNGKLVTVAPSITQNKTTYVPIWYVMHTLNSLHIQSKWNGKQWSLSTKTKLNIDWKKVKPGKGDLEIYLNGHLVERVTGLAAKDKNTGNKTTYMPIWYVTQVLKSMKIQSDWNGTTWNLKN